MAGDNNHPPGITALLGRVARLGMGMLRTRGELLALEYQEEKARRIELMMLALGAVLLAFLGMALLTGIIILLFPGDWRLYVAGIFTILYFAGAFWAGSRLKSMVDEPPFAESLEQMRKDKAWLESFK
ncbi:conserved hypothetical protein [Verrucomicrobia bacterium]|nr:conserved hypothetical protein [Verrucomicrobiota bacterium]